MDKYEHITIRITDHAHERYCERVEKIPEHELQALCTAQLHGGEMDYDKKGWFHLAGVWWTYEQRENEMIFITCYGRSDMRMPRAMKWAAHHRDRIDLQALL